jgi:hypothetical protein
MRSLVIEQVGDSAAVLQVADIDDPASTDGHALLKVTARPYLLLRPQLVDTAPRTRDAIARRIDIRIESSSTSSVIGQRK